ncbi:hypothetical protein DN050_14100 [Heyndrickxia coagulans]|nr:hypothetical protein DN050_14100 [Heyndrickxia coagulans]
MDIISIIAGLLKDTKSLMEFEEQIKILMQKVFTQWVGDVFEELDKTIKQKKLEEGWEYCRSDNRSVQFLFGSVTFKRSLMRDKRGNSHYPLDECLGLVPHRRYSPLVELKVAELASENTYREVANILKEWTAVSLSHTTVGEMVKRVGKTQVEADKALVEEMEIAASLPDGKKVDYLFSEADGVFVRGLKKKQSMEVHHIRAFVLSLAQWGLIVEAREIYETPAGKASQERPRSEVRARRLAGRPRKASEFRAPQHPRYPSLYGNITSFPKITPSK